MDSGVGLGRFRRVFGLLDKAEPAFERRLFTARLDEVCIHEALVNHGVGDCIQQRHICTRLNGKVKIGFHVRCTHQLNTTWVNNDKVCALAQSSLEPRPKDGVCFRGIGPHNHNDVSIRDRREVLRARGLSKCLLQAVAGGRMADARAGVDIVVTKSCTHHFLNQPNFFIGTT